MFVIQPILDPNPKLPHLPAMVRNVTLDELLDQIAQTFGGVVVYQECTANDGSRVFSIRFHELR